MAGQGHVLKTLINALDHQRLHHAYLFTGTRGVGKTTLARILSKCLNCEEGISSTPCNSCASCVEINEGRFIDLIEVDAASRTKVEDTRELLENVQYMPARGRFKVYLIDEVHMLSNHSFNALLKTLEEPPPHVKFLFATTDPHKLPVTILSRCLQLNLKNLTPQIISEHLRYVLTEEKLKFDDSALWQIAGAAAGSMRDALTLTDQAISFCGGDVNSDGVVDMLGIPDQQKIFELLAAMSESNVPGLLELIKKLAEQSPDYLQLLDSLISTFHRIAIAQVLEQGVDNSLGDRQQILDFAGRFTAEDIQLYYQFSLKGREDLQLSTDMRSAMEMLLIRMMVFSPHITKLGTKPTTDPSTDPTTDPTTKASDGVELTQEIEKKKTLASPSNQNRAALETSQQKTEQQAQQTPLTEQTQVQASIQANESTFAKTAQPKSDNVTFENLNVAVATTQSSPSRVSNEPADVQASTQQQSTNAKRVDSENCEDKNSQPSSVDTLMGSEDHKLVDLNHERWLKLVPNFQASGITANILANCEFQSATANSIELLLDQTQSAVYNSEQEVKAAQALGEYFQREVKVVINVGKVTLETSAAMRQRLKQEKQRKIVEDFEQDENVQGLVTHFSGSIVRDSIVAINK